MVELPGHETVAVDCSFNEKQLANILFDMNKYREPCTLSVEEIICRNELYFVFVEVF